MYERNPSPRVFGIAASVLSALAGMTAIVVVPALALLAIEDHAFQSWKVSENASSRSSDTAGVVATEGYVLPMESPQGKEHVEAGKARSKSAAQSSGQSLNSATRSGLITTKQPKIISIFGGGDSFSTNGSYYSITPGSNALNYGFSSSGGTSNYSVVPSGNYRTLCVRLCDGFYWPISYSTSQSGFEADESACQSSCGSPVKLFYYDSHGAGPEEAVDLRGKSYQRLKNAFRYRTEFDSACKCRPDPWEESSLAKHRTYALLAKQGKLALLDTKPGKKKKKSLDKGITGSGDVIAMTQIGTLDQNGQVVSVTSGTKKSLKDATAKLIKVPSAMGLGASSKITRQLSVSSRQSGASNQSGGKHKSPGRRSGELGSK